MSRFASGSTLTRTSRSDSFRAFEPVSLPLEQKIDLCASLLDEFGVAYRHNPTSHEMIHPCLLSPGVHSDQDRNPTASLNAERLVVHCLGCGASGGILWFIATVRGTSAAEARQWLNEQTGLGGGTMDLPLLMRYLDALYKPKDRPAPPPHLSEKMLRPWAWVHPYLTDPRSEGGRGIREENVLQMRVGYAENYEVGGGKTSERIVIPHFWKGQLVGWQTRRLGNDGTPKYLSSPEFPKDQTIYNYEPTASRTVVVEAPLSAVAKVHLSPHIEATFSASVTSNQIKLLEKHPTVVLFMDNDRAGWQAVEGHDTFDKRGRLIKHTPGMGEMLGRTSVVLVVENPWAADPADLSDEDYLNLVRDAVPFSIWRRPKTLLCYQCNRTAHEGQCVPTYL